MNRLHFAYKHSISSYKLAFQFTTPRRFAVSYDMVKQKSRDVLKSSDVRNIEWVDSQYFSGMRTAEHTLTCEIRGEPFRLTYEVSKHNDGEGFVIHSDGKDI